MRVSAAATLVLRNGKIITVDRRFSIAEAVAIGEGKVLHVGRSLEMQPFIGPETRVLELGGQCVIPGFIDTHAHMDREGMKDQFPSLAGSRSIAETVDIIAQEVVKKRPGEWLITNPIGTPPFYFDAPVMVAEKRVPTRWDLDAASPENPVYIQAIWGYWGWPPLVSVLNSRALEVCGITRHTQPPWEGIEILKDRQGEPTGVVLEHHFVPALEFTLLEQAPRFTLAQRTAGLSIAMQRYTAAGTTSIYEGHGVDPDLMLAYKHLWARREMIVRAHLLFTPPAKSIPEFREQVEDWTRAASGAGIGDDWLRVGGVCFQLSGNQTVAELRRRAKPYTGWAGHYHDPVTPEQLRALVMLAAENDLRVCVLADQIPEHVTPMRDLFDRGIPVTIETDGSPIEPLHALWALLTRCERETGEVIAPRQKISRAEALQACTLNGAYLTFDEERTGSLEPGKWADLVVLAEDLLTVPEDRIKAIPVTMTVVGGRIVHEIPQAMV
ncbi:MAG: amidohydrolase family protein [Nitrospinae bacterium]|nr:amidohydrolase family protein [Nitrospinota bacterium]